MGRLALVAGLLAFAAKADAERVPDVLLVGDARPGLCTALRIQHPDPGAIRCVPAIDAGAPPSVRGVAQAVRAAGAQVGAWVETWGREVRLFVVAEARDTALLRVGELPGESAASLDRALALKVLEILRLVRRARSARGVADPSALLRPARRPGPWRPSLQVSGVVAGPAARWIVGTGASLGGAHVVGRVQVDLAVAVEGFAGTGVRTAAGRLDLSEWVPSLRAFVGRAWAPWITAGPFGEVGVRSLRVRGVTSDGARGDLRELWAVGRLGMSGRARLWPRGWLELRAALEASLRRQRFALNERVAADMGRLRAVFGVGVIAHMR